MAYAVLAIFCQVPPDSHAHRRNNQATQSSQHALAQTHAYTELTLTQGTLILCAVLLLLLTFTRCVV